MTRNIERQTAMVTYIFFRNIILQEIRVNRKRSCSIHLDLGNKKFSTLDFHKTIPESSVALKLESLRVFFKYVDVLRVRKQLR